MMLKFVSFRCYKTVFVTITEPGYIDAENPLQFPRRNCVKLRTYVYECRNRRDPAENPSTEAQIYRRRLLVGRSVEVSGSLGTFGRASRRETEQNNNKRLPVARVDAKVIRAVGRRPPETALSSRGRGTSPGRSRRCLPAGRARVSAGSCWRRCTCKRRKLRFRSVLGSHGCYGFIRAAAPT